MSVDSSARRVADSRRGSASASASALNVASVRPAIGRVKQRSTNAREARAAAAGSRARSSTRQPPPVGSIRQVTSIPFVAPADVDEAEPAASRARSRSATARRPAGRARGRRTAAAARRSPRRHDAVGAAVRRTRDRDVVGEQPLPALDVPGEREDELRRRRDVDRRSRSSSRSAPGRHETERVPCELDTSFSWASLVATRTSAQRVGGAVELVAQLAAGRPRRGTGSPRKCRSAPLAYCESA